MGTNFFTNEKENTLLEKIEGVFKYKKLSLCVNLHNIMIFSAQGLFWRKIG